MASKQRKRRRKRRAVKKAPPLPPVSAQAEEEKARTRGRRSAKGWRACLFGIGLLCALWTALAVSLPPTVLRSDVLEMKDLKPEMELTGTVRNVVDFGAFVDIGVHEDGLVHISQIGEKYVKHPGEVLKVGDIVRVKVLEVDQKRGRISLTMRGVKQPAQL